jgi:kynureninase
MIFHNTLQFAQELDTQDVLAKYREAFIFPQHNNKSVIYFTGNSLGLQPKTAKAYVDEVMLDWANLGVEGHFYAQKPWWDYQERFAEPLSKIVGAKPSEVTVMNTLTVNLHLLMFLFIDLVQNAIKLSAKKKPSLQISICFKVRWIFMVSNQRTPLLR